MLWNLNLLNIIHIQFSDQTKMIYNERDSPIGVATPPMPSVSRSKQVLNSKLGSYTVRANHSRVHHVYSLKTPAGSNLTRKGSIWGQTPFRVKDDPEIGQLSADLTYNGVRWPSSGSYSASSWLISGSSLTRNGVWPQWTLSGSSLTRFFF